MIQVHHLNHSRSQRILWLLEELALEYDVIKYYRDLDTELAPASLKKVHPLGKAPILVDDGVKLAESGVIVDYLAQRYGKKERHSSAHEADFCSAENLLLPEKESQAWWDYGYWLHYAEASLMPPLLLRLVFDKIKSAPVPFFIRPIINKIVASVDQAFLHQQLHGQLSYVADHLSCHQWMLGERFSAADIQMSFPLEAAMSNKKLADCYPRLNAYVQQLHARPAYLRALAKGGDYCYGPKSESE
ncbi:glutathione S-transferase [Oceanisphaera avium]|uniref:glutathione transferase n=1 Tax=Oceanisphaera avium TaxID=1903694 RepID=A0A1Y0D0F0_9GAMM|nr:glutathione S-transferase [Oceanisphaera avium]ART80724.1 glutathione S-transferase [Oceanisphaera avium]